MNILETERAIKAGQEASIKLQEFAHLKGKRLIVIDWDETMISRKTDPDITASNAISLVADIEQAGIVPLIATARGVTMVRTFLEEFSKIEETKQGPKGTIYIAGVDGRSLMKYLGKGKTELIYEHRLTNQQLEAAFRVLGQARKIIGSPDQEAVEVFQEFLKHDWTGLLTQRDIDLTMKSRASIFVEPVKISVAGPKDPDEYKKEVDYLNENLHSFGLNASWHGKDKFIQLRADFEKDGKLIALKKVAKLEKVSFSNVAAFGDAPKGNDIGILSESPFGFTNDIDFIADHIANHPPYVLVGSSPVMTVHSALKKIISTSR